MKQMKIRNIITSIILTATALGGFAQTNALRAKHNEIHKNQLANVKSKLDRTVIDEIIMQDVASRSLQQNIEESVSPETAAMAADLLKEARSHLGKRYRAGAKGPSSFDCSGFSSYVFNQFGYKLSPSSRAQYTQGTPVKRSELRPGDLVFFTSRRSGKNVGHVGIVVSAKSDGSFNFIHAARTGIKVDNCAGYYEGRYIGARRIL